MNTAVNMRRVESVKKHCRGTRVNTLCARVLRRQSLRCSLTVVRRDTLRSVRVQERER